MCTDKKIFSIYSILKTNRYCNIFSGFESKVDFSNHERGKISMVQRKLCM